MSAAAWYLGIDVGTGGVKIAAVRPDGQVAAAHFASIDTEHTSDGGATQDPSTWWVGIVAGVRSIVDGTEVAPDACRGIGITGQWGSTVPVGADARPIGPCLLWSDDRGGRWSADVTGGAVKVAGYDPRKIATWIRLTGGAPSTSGADPTGHTQVLRHLEPERYAATTALLEPVDFIGARLTGRIAATPASMVASWLTDNRPGRPVAYDPRLVALAQRDADRLPPLLPTGSILGPLLASAADELGLPASTPVVCGVPDLHTAALGAGAVDDYAGHVAISTTAWVSAPVPFKKTDIAHQIASIPGLRSGSYLIANNHETGGACLRWFRDAMYADDPSGPPTYDDITASAAGVAPGSGGVIFAPWLKGERSPVEDRMLRASFVNVGMSATRASLARAVLEGVAYNARWLLEATEKFAGRPLADMRILGGGAVSALWCQIHADVMGRPITRVADPLNVNVRGAAWFAALALGHTTAADLRAHAVAGDVFTPDPVAMRTYDPLYREMTGLAKQQKSMYHRLNRRTARP